MNVASLTRRLWLALVTPLLVLVVGACSEDPAAPLAPFEPQINNIQDSFEFQATGVTNVTWTFEYTWANSGTAANVNQATTVTAGAATLTLLDAAGTQVYTQSLSANGTFPTTVGPTGNWRVRVVFTNYSGTVNFRAEKS